MMARGNDGSAPVGVLTESMRAGLGPAMPLAQRAQGQAAARAKRRAKNKQARSTRQRQRR